MRYHIFGGNGFVGRELIAALKAEGIDYAAYDIAGKDPDSIRIDIRDQKTIDALEANQEDIVINLAANQYHGAVPKDARKFFFETNTNGAGNILDWAFRRGIQRCVLFTTDMVYGKPQYLPVDETHPKHPFGFYGQSKMEAEAHAQQFRQRGMNITIFRPRMIVGPGRMGILRKLFKLIDLNLPVPLIGRGRNHYQMVSVHDCVTAILKGVEHGCPNGEYNLGSKNPPTVRKLLQDLIKSANSKSILVPTYAPLMKTTLAAMEKMGIPLMRREQYMIADEEYILDISRAERELGWEPIYNDSQMLAAAYDEYKKDAAIAK